MHSPSSPIGPPSYELSVAEKARGAHSQQPRRIVDEDGWLVYDAAAFEAAANEASTASSSRAPSSYGAAVSLSNPKPRRSLGRLVAVNARADDDDDDPDGPPPFTPTTPAYSAQGFPPHAHQHPAARPASPLSSPPHHATQFLAAPPPRTQTVSPRRRPHLTMAPSTPALSTYGSPRPSLAQHTHVSAPPARTARMQFDPGMAYAESAGSAGVSALYGSHVASAMAVPQSRATQRNPTPSGHRPSMSMSLSPSTASSTSLDRADRSSMYSRASNSSAGSASRSPGAHPSPGWAQSSLPPGAARASVISAGSPQWAANESQLFRDIYRGH